MKQPMKNQKVPKKKNNFNCFDFLSRILLYALFLLLPTQLGKHFFFNFSFLNGIRVDYLAPTIHVTDMIVLLLIILNIRRCFLFLKKLPIILLLLTLLIPVITARIPLLALYRYIKIVEVVLLFAIISRTKLSSKYVLLAFFIGSCIEIVLVILQIANNHSIQGLFYWLGERYYSASTIGIAKIVMNGNEIVRPYGTFPHPNVMAGFYLVLYFYVFLEKKYDRFFILKNLFLFFASVLILCSFSKITIILLVVGFFIFVIKNTMCRWCAFAKLCVLCVLGFIFLQGGNDPLSLQKRLELAQNAFFIIIRYPLFGVGLSNYLVVQNNFPLKYLFFFQQPVHNIFLLFISETGIIIGGFFIYKLILIIKRNYSYKPFLCVVCIIVATGMMDHYWLTIQQTFLLMGVMGGLLLKFL